MLPPFYCALRFMYARKREKPFLKGSLRPNGSIKVFISEKLSIHKESMYKLNQIIFKRIISLSESYYMMKYIACSKIC